MRERKPGSRSLGVLAVAVAAGFLFGTNVRLFDPDSPQDISELLEERAVTLEELETDVAALRAQRDSALELQNPEVPVVSPALISAVDEEAVAGPGLRVRLWDAPSVTDSSVDPNDLVVHQQDIEAVVNALWAGGAEAMTLQGQRITTTTAIRCVGNVLLLHGRQYSPPYAIEAIGNQAALQDALAAAPEIQIYQQWVDMVGLGWEVTRLSAIEAPAYDGPRQVTRAVVDEEGS
ncbi:Uncharacterized conserved protein YlxW, UPF0749 family [Ruaniaceae bacterium KH17]|nr:Uncharacterized conserved protein YlxW, UPF0749 family [Ruaniaceae bacterium KH17]